MPERLCLLSVHAHPDDEASKGAPTVARYHAEGVHTVLVCCTGGEEGDILNPAMDTPEVRADIGRVRMAELKASTDIIGYDETVLLGYRDSGMPDTEANARPDSFAQAPLDEAVGRLVAVIRRERPQVIITYGDDQTEYPHPDHLRVHEISVLAFDSAGDPDRFPEAGPPFTPAKLYYSVWSGERFRQIHEKFVELGLEVTLRRQVADAHDQDRAVHHDHRRHRVHPRAGRGAEGARHAGRPQLEVLVRPAARGDARHPSGRRVPPGPEPRRPDRRDRGRPLRRGARRVLRLGHGAEEAPADDAGALQQHDDHRGGQDAEQHDGHQRLPDRRRRRAPRGLTAGGARLSPASASGRPAAAGTADRLASARRRAVARPPDAGARRPRSPGVRLGGRARLPLVASRMTVSRSSSVQPLHHQRRHRAAAAQRQHDAARPLLDLPL